MTAVDDYRAGMDELVRLAGVDLDVLWRQVSASAEADEALGSILPSLVRTYGEAAGTLAAEWYEDIRSSIINTRFRAIVADLPDVGRTDSLARWATEPLRLPEPDDAAALSRLKGGMQRIIANAGRETVMGSSISDPRAAGWKRMASGMACGFCRMLANRGAVYSERSVDFGAHDHCGCMAAPEFGSAGDAIFTTRKVEKTRKVSDAERAATKRWMAEHGY